MNVKRIFCIGRNYAKHVAELGNTPDGDCVVFMKPPSCIVDEGEPVVLPRGIGAIHHEAELVVLLTGGGRDIAVDEALD
jgi:2-keto-4-pentenoate hydratase/2-oxohepta-3-ene-1,7-dioic acid hydratase in catechol pathway